MDALPSFWSARRILIIGGESRCGAALAESLVECGADVSVMIGSASDPQSPFFENRSYERMGVVRADVCNRDAVARSLAVKEMEAVVLAEPLPALAVHAVLSAARKAVPRAAVVVSVSSGVSRVVAVAEAFRVAGGNPIGVIVGADLAPLDNAVPIMRDLVERVIRREPTALRGTVNVPMMRLLAA